MPLYQFKREQKVKSTLPELWDFISSPRNLKEITPDHMGFDITSGDLPEKMYPGMIIIYTVRPLLGIGMTWVTEITHVEHERYFVDEQRVGPCSIWHHEHHLEPIEGGVLMRDIVSYQPPMGFLGAIANSVVIRAKLQEIFDYRVDAVEKRFGKFEK